MEISKLAVGTELPSMVKEVRQEEVNLYARASGDYNPIHIDPDFAKKTPMGGTIAHGMLILAYISELMTASFGESWIKGGSLEVRFRVPARPGDRISVSGQVSAIEREGNAAAIKCQVSCRNQDGEVNINGEAAVAVAGAVLPPAIR